MIEKIKLGFVVALSMTLGAAGVVGIDSLRDEPGTTTTVIERVSPSQTDGVSLSINSVADLVEKVRPSIVRINVVNSSGNGGGVGSGIVLDKDGHILTNNHVVSDSGSIDVVLADGTVGSAIIVGRDPGNDLALLKADIPADKLVPAKLGDSSSVRVGEFVIAVGNPFEIDGTVTEGIVSGIGRSLRSTGGRPLRELIQSDAAINPGNSGGGLFNERGEVIGITTAIENPTSGRVFIGIGYAVPINLATRFLPNMLAGDTIQHPRIGISLNDVTPAVATSLGLDPAQRGVLVITVEPDSGAADAGLRGGRNGDVIIDMDGTPIKTFDDLARFVDSKQVGDTVQITILRDGAEIVMPLTLKAWASSST